MNDGRELEPALPEQPIVTTNKMGGNEPGKGLPKQKGASSDGDKSDKNVIPMGRPLSNEPGRGLGKTNSGSYRS